jgi:hypothetical protein
MKNKKIKKLLVSFLNWYDEELNLEERESSVNDFLTSKKKIKISDIKDTIHYLREFKKDAEKEKNKDKVIAYETCLRNFEDLIL